MVIYIKSFQIVSWLCCGYGSCIWCLSFGIRSTLPWMTLIEGKHLKLYAFYDIHVLSNVGYAYSHLSLWNFSCIIQPSWKHICNRLFRKDGRQCGSLLNRRVKGYSSQHVETIYETWNYWAAKSKDSEHAAHSTNSIITKSFYKSYAMDINMIQRLMYSYITAPRGVVYECPIVYCNMHHHLIQHPFCSSWLWIIVNSYWWIIRGLNLHVGLLRMCKSKTRYL